MQISSSNPSKSCVPFANYCRSSGYGVCNDLTDMENDAESCGGGECYYGMCSGNSDIMCNDASDCATFSAGGCSVPYSLGSYPNFQRYCYCMQADDGVAIVG